MSKEVMRQARDALENHRNQTRPVAQTEEAIAALTAALALPDAQPVAWRTQHAGGWGCISNMPHQSCKHLFEPLYLAPQQVIAPEPVEPDKERAVIEAAKEWSSERIPTDHSEGELMKAVASLEGDWPGCEDCDHECDAPCMPATVVQMHASIDACLEKLEAKKAADARKHWIGIEQAAQPAN